MPNVFFSYSHKDEALRNQLETQLAMLKRQGIIEAWHDRRIEAGQNIDTAIDDHINSDGIILLLVSPDFIASDYCYNIEMNRAMERHQAGEAIVIPIILRACDWKPAPFGKLKAVPRDGKPVTQWPDADEAFLQVAQAVRKATEQLTGRKVDASPKPSSSSISVQSTATLPRSSNLRLAKDYTQRDKDKFQLDAFEFIARYFENSLTELEKRNPVYEGMFRRIDATRFFATIYHNGKDVARATIYIGSGYMRGINYVQGETTQSNTMNESLTVQADDQTLYLSGIGMSFYGSGRDKKLSMTGGAELFWSMLIAPLQQKQL